jgi:hypothetical protein
VAVNAVTVSRPLSKMVNKPVSSRILASCAVIRGVTGFLFSVAQRSLLIMQHSTLHNINLVRMTIWPATR